MYLVKSTGTEFVFHSFIISATAFGRQCLHHYSYLFMDVVLLILFDVDILHLNVLKGGIPGFIWVFSLVFTGVTQYQHFVV